MLRDDLARRFPAVRRLPPGAYAVGGAVRDLLLGREPVDVDVAVPDVRSAAEAIGGRVVELGRGDLVALRVLRDGVIYDLAPIAGDRDRDLARRDCTVNAIAIDLATGELLDPHRGRADLAARVVRMIDAKNFDDDPLRMLKVLRVAVQLDFEVEEGTMNAIRDRAPSITTVAPERVTSELLLMLSERRARRAVRLLSESKLDAEIFGRLVDASVNPVDDLSAAAVLSLLVDSAEEAARRWRWSEELRRDVAALQRLLHTPDAELRVAVYDAGGRVAAQLAPLFRAAGRDTPSIDAALFEITPLLSGDDIARIAGLTPGRRLGEVKRALLVEQIHGRIGSREDAEAFVARAVDRDVTS